MLRAAQCSAALLVQDMVQEGFSEGLGAPRAAAVGSEEEGPEESVAPWKDFCFHSRLSKTLAATAQEGKSLFVGNKPRQMPPARKQPVPPRQEALNK